MELKEAAVSSLVDYLYTGHLALPSHICRLLELATAAHCFQLQVRSVELQTKVLEGFTITEKANLCLRLSHLSLITGSCWLQEIVDWVYDIIVGNVSNTVFVNRGYDKMEQMELVTHLQSLNVTTWEEIRNSRATFR